MSEIRVGTILYGYCGGLFDDSYTNKRVEVVGVDYIVVRDEDGEPLFASNDRIDVFEFLKDFLVDPYGE